MSEKQPDIEQILEALRTAPGKFVTMPLANPSFRQPKIVCLTGGPHDGKIVGVSPDTTALHFAVDPTDAGDPRRDTYRIEGDMGVYEGMAPAEE
jgi:hypothetical protein